MPGIFCQAFSITSCVYLSARQECERRKIMMQLVYTINGPHQGDSEVSKLMSNIWDTKSKIPGLCFNIFSFFFHVIPYVILEPRPLVVFRFP